MKELDVRTIACFDVVASLIGRDIALQELATVAVNLSGEKALMYFMTELSLNRAFVWDDTPQGHEYWASIFYSLNWNGDFYEKL
jgi:hypothetical protein